MSDLEDAVDEKMRAYAQCFGSAAGQIVLADLEAFCFAIESIAVPGNSDRTFMNEGRREVMLRIQKFTLVTMKDLYHLRLGRPTQRDMTGDENG